MDEGEREVVRYLRREAIMSLVKIGVPALIAPQKKTGIVEGPAAYGLLRVLVKQGERKRTTRRPLSPSGWRRPSGFVTSKTRPMTRAMTQLLPSTRLAFASMISPASTAPTTPTSANEHPKGKNAKSRRARFPRCHGGIQSERPCKEAAKELVANARRTRLLRRTLSMLERATSSGIADSMKKLPSKSTLNDLNCRSATMVDRMLASKIG